MATRSKVQLYEQIRRAHAAQETKSIRALARQFRVHRRDVRAALDSAVPPPRKTPERPAPKMDQYKAIIDSWLTEDQKWPRKQRHTARRVWQRLVAEHQADVGACGSPAHGSPMAGYSKHSARVVPTPKCLMARR